MELSQQNLIYLIGLKTAEAFELKSLLDASIKSHQLKDDEIKELNILVSSLKVIAESVEKVDNYNAELDREVSKLRKENESITIEINAAVTDGHNKQKIIDDLKKQLRKYETNTVTTRKRKTTGSKSNG